MPLRVGFGRIAIMFCEIDAHAVVSVREHFSSPLLQFAEADGGKTFTLVECPSTYIAIDGYEAVFFIFAKVEPDS